MTSKLLVPLDGSTLAETAVPWAVFLAKTRGYTPVLAQVIPWPTMVSDGLMVGYTPPEVYDEILDAEREAATDYLASVTATLAAQGVESETVIRQGSTTAGLLDLTHELGVDAILMATHGRTGWRRAVLGSVANSVVQAATVPVLLVHAGAEERAPAIDRVLVPLDGSALAERAVDATLAWGQPAPLVVLTRVVESLAGPPQESDTLVQPVALLTRLPTTVHEATEEPPDEPEPPARDPREEADTYLKSITARLVKQGLRVKTHVLVGAPAEQIMAAAHAHNVDLIVMGTHGRSGPTRWLLGSVADEVVRHADRPVLLVSMRTRGMEPPAEALETATTAPVSEAEPVAT